MEPISTPFDLSSSSSSSSDPKTAIMNQIRQETAITNARTLMAKLTQNCFASCVPSPGSSLSKKEETCMSMCMEKYMAMWNTVSRTYVDRIRKEQQAGGQGFGV